MNPDLYTKTILTVIAASLVWICVNGATPVALAQTSAAPPMRVVLVHERNVPVENGAGVRVNLGAQAVPVARNVPEPSRIRPVGRHDDHWLSLTEFASTVSKHRQ